MNDPTEFARNARKETGGWPETAAADHEHGPDAGRPKPLPRLVRVTLALPLFYKILLANAALVVIGAVAGSVITANAVRTAPERSTFELVGALAAAGAVLSVLVNAAILRLALRPLDGLEAAADRVRNGDLDARAPGSVLADRALQRLIATFNGMLESLTAHRQRLREVAARALDAAEEERKRIARELHDETAQVLAALLIRLRIARGLPDPDEKDAMLEDVRREIAQAMEGVRRFARGLRPPALDELGLATAIESHARNLAKAGGIAIDVTADNITGLLLPDAELALYRAVQEALSNVVRHARASRARVRIRRLHDHVVASVEDDGRGFAPDEAMAANGRGLGLFGMQERAAYVGGTVQIHSEPGRGTRVLIEIPITELADHA